MRLFNIMTDLKENIFISSSEDIKNSFMPMKVENINLILNKKILLDDINFELGSNLLTVLMGPNGAGKSLLLKVINGILKPTSGLVLWAGNELSIELRRRQSFVFQKPILLRRSVSENISFVQKIHNKIDRDRKDALLKIVNLFGQRNQAARSLSLGEQQRLSIIRALALDPELIILDEPTASLDPTSTVIIENLIMEIKKAGIKIIFVTHDILQAKRIADEILFLDKGKIIEHTDADQFFVKPQSDIATNYLEGKL